MEETFYKEGNLKKNHYRVPPWGILIHADFRPMGISFHPAVVVGSGNDLLFNSILAHCEL